MKILFITQWYKPIKAPVKRMARIAEHLAKRGNEVTVLTGLPSYPTGVLPPKYRWKLWALENENKVKIIRTYEYPAPNRGIFKRLINNLSFTISSTIAVLFLRSQDLVIISSPSFLSGISAIIAAKINKSRFVFDIRDLWPDSAIEMGYLKNRVQIWLLKSLERFFYKRADIILVATPAIKNHLIFEKIPKEKISLLLNSVDIDFFKPQKIDRTKFGFSKDDFIVIYVGNHGPAQGLETTINCGRLLKKYPKIKFLFIGEGEDKESLIALSQKFELKNVRFLPEKTPKEIVEFINLSNLGNVSLAKGKIFQEAMPTKSSEYLACGKPIIAAVGGALQDYLNVFSAGFTYRAGQPQTEANAILKIYKNHKLANELGQRARELALEVFSDKIFYENLDKTLFG